MYLPHHLNCGALTVEAVMEPYACSQTLVVRITGEDGACLPSPGGVTLSGACYSEYGPKTSNVGFTSELVRDAKSQFSPQTKERE